MTSFPQHPLHIYLLNASADIYNDHRYSLRKATLADAQLYFHWINNPEYKNLSGRDIFISWDSHLSTFSSNLQSDSHLMLLFLFDEQVVGQISFALANSSWSVGYHIDSAYRRRGFGRKLVILGLAYLLNSCQGHLPSFTAKVKHNNHSSLKILESLGFHRKESLCQSMFLEYVLHF